MNFSILQLTTTWAAIAGLTVVCLPWEGANASRPPAPAPHLEETAPLSYRYTHNRHRGGTGRREILS